MNATKVGSQNLNGSPQSAEPGRDNTTKDLKETGRNNANVIVGFELLTSCRLLMRVIMELCVPFGLQILFQNLSEHILLGQNVLQLHNYSLHQVLWAGLYQRGVERYFPV